MANKQRYIILRELADNYMCRNIAEIGVSAGHTAIFLLQHCPFIESYTLVEPDRNNVLSIDYLKKWWDAKVIWHKMLSNEAIKYVNDNTLDLIFIDANHSYENVKEDIELWYPKLKKFGILSGHDYKKNDIECKGVVKAVDEKFKNINLIEDDLGVNIWWIIKEQDELSNM